MIDQADPLAAMPSTLDTSRLEKVGEPLHRVLSDLIAGCSPDQDTSTIATAGLVLSIWQLQGRTLSEQVPSQIFLNAGEAASDPIDKFVQDFVHEEEATGPGQKGPTAEVPYKPEQAPKIMEQAIRERRALGYSKKPEYWSERNARAHEQNYRQASKSAYGIGWSRAYSRAWAKPFGLLTGPGNQVILRLNEAPDRAAFRHHVIEDPRPLLMPEGIGQHLLTVHKTASLSGSLTMDLWDEALVSGIIRLGLPVVFLPHTAHDPMVLPNAPAMKALPYLWRSAPVTRAMTPLSLPPIDWFEAHTADVRRRLHLLPGSGNYEFAILQLLRQLGSVCSQIANYAAKNSVATEQQVVALYWELHARTFRGITLGIAALAWHGLGFDPGCPHAKAVKVLQLIREKGSIKKSELLLAKGARVDAATRNILIQRLADEDLLRVEGKTITATSFQEFTEAVRSRKELPEAAKFCDKLKKAQQDPD